MKTKFAILALIAAFALPARAQTDLLPRLPSTTLLGATTNTTPVAEPIGWRRDEVLVFQFTCTGTNVIAGTNVVMKFDTSNDGTYWVSNQYTMTCTFPGAAQATTISRITNTVGGQWLRLRPIENINPASGGTITINAFNYLK